MNYDNVAEPSLRVVADTDAKQVAATSRTAPGIGYVPALDGLRGAAVLAVMVGHALGPGTSYFAGPSVGVDVFFVLSGFLITFLLVREYDQGQQRIIFRNFYARRVLRLAPALFGMLIAITLVGWVLFTRERAESTTTDAFIALLYAANWARAFDIHPPVLFGHAWSLSTEEQFYLLWPIVLWSLLRNVRSRLNVVMAISAGAIACWLWRVTLLFEGASINRLYNGLDTRGDCLLVGCALGMLLASNLIKEEARPVIAGWLRRIAPVAGALFLWVLVFGDWSAAYMYYWLFAVIEVLATAIILQIFVAPTSATRSLLSWRPLVWVGTISYGLYLWHYPVYRLSREFGVSFDQAVPHIRVVIATAATFLAATVSYYMLERPILRLKRYFGPASSETPSTHRRR